MNKKHIITSTLAGAALFAIGQHAQAADVESPVSDVSQKDEVTNLDEVKSQLTQVKDEKAMTEQALASEQANLEKTKQALVDTTKQLNATPEQDVENLEQQLVTTDSQIGKQENKVSELKSTLAQSQQAVDEATMKMKQAENTVKQEKATLEQLKQQASPVNTDKLTQDLAQAKQDVTAKTQDVEKAQKNLEQANKIATEKSQLSDQIQQKTTTIDKLQADIDVKTKALNDLGDTPFIFPNEIKLTPEYIDAFNRLLKSRVDDDDAAWNQAQKDLANLPSGIEIMNDIDNMDIPQGPKIYDIRNLPDEVKIELNQYFVTLVNSIHKQLGDGKTLYANTNIIQIADDVARGYEAHGGAMPTRGHIREVLREAARKNGIYFVGESLGYEVVEEPNYDGYKLSLEELKRIVQSHTVGMMIFDSESKYGHALHIIGAETMGIGFSIVDGIDKDYYQLKIDDLVLYDENKVKSLGMHVISAGDKYSNVIANTREDQKRIYAEKYDVQSPDTLPLSTFKPQDTASQQRQTLPEVIRDLKAELVQEKLAQYRLQSRANELADLPNTTAESQQALANAQFALTQAQDKLASINMQLSQANNQVQLVDLINTQQTHVNNALTQLESMRANAANLTHDLEIAKQKYNQAVANLETYHVSYSKLTDELAKAKDNNHLRSELITKLALLTAEKESHETTIRDLMPIRKQLNQTIKILSDKILDLETKAFLSGKTDVVPFKPTEEIKQEFVAPTDKNKMKKPEITQPIEVVKPTEEMKQEFVVPTDKHEVKKPEITQPIEVVKPTEEMKQEFVVSTDKHEVKQPKMAKPITNHQATVWQSTNNVAVDHKMVKVMDDKVSQVSTTQAPLGTVVKALPNTGITTKDNLLIEVGLISTVLAMIKFRHKKMK